ncbi:hypothetical protein M0R45_032460 [Rubus argutus]|uniref:Uncharacterized protein n=1 Tax=Rubus argutus TaxID=59490 RepID=A0AAW1WHR1_RUBAR
MKRKSHRIEMEMEIGLHWYGLVERVRIPLQPDSNQMVLQNRGFCYVTFANLHSRNHALMEGCLQVFLSTLQESRVLRFTRMKIHKGHIAESPVLKDHLVTIGLERDSNPLHQAIPSLKKMTKCSWRVVCECSFLHYKKAEF